MTTTLRALLAKLDKPFPPGMPDTPEYRRAIIQYQAERREAARAIEAILDENDELREALRPFAEQVVPKGWKGDEAPPLLVTLEPADFRRARKAWENHTKERGQ